MILTQEQANAIADRECPAQDAPGWTAYSAHIKIQRQAYAKCLMDLNPLIEAASVLNEDVREGTVVAYYAEECVTGHPFDALDTALSNLTKNVAHLMTAPNPNK